MQLRYSRFIGDRLTAISLSPSEKALFCSCKDGSCFVFAVSPVDHSLDPLESFQAEAHSLCKASFLSGDAASFLLPICTDGQRASFLYCKLTDQGVVKRKISVSVLESAGFITCAAVRGVGAFIFGTDGGFLGRAESTGDSCKARWMSLPEPAKGSTSMHDS